MKSTFAFSKLQAEIVLMLFLFGTTSLSFAQTGKWTYKTSMPTARGFTSGAVFDGRIYVIGGFPTHRAVTGVNEMYDPETDSWTEKAPMPTARGMLSACAIKGEIYAIGGTVNFLTSGFNFVEVYDPETDTWTTETPVPTSRVSLATCVLNDKIYAVGGFNYPVVYAINEMYNPDTDRWTTESPMQVTRQTFFLGTVGDKMYAIGGSYPNPQNTNEPVILNSVEEYDFFKE